MVEKVTRKSFIIRPSGRSSDYIAPSFGYGCLLNCTYCYMKRHKPQGLSVAKNIEDILTVINNHAMFDTTEKPNQTHEEYITYDIACNEDFALHRKYYDWKKIFTFFRDHPKAMGTFATKIIPKEFLEFNPKKKVRIRFSLMPVKFKNQLEPNTPSIFDKLHAVNKFIKAGYDVHLNFSPVIVHNDWLEEYRKLFITVNSIIKESYKDQVKAEVIFLTHNVRKHEQNIKDRLTGEELLWRPDLQEEKISQYGGKNIRYQHVMKETFIKVWTNVHDEIIPWNTIRYIF